jgi:S-adenosyl-L-homocysteine hydrolase, NAD binding domain
MAASEPAACSLKFYISLQVAPMRDVMDQVDIFVTTTGNKDIIMVRSHRQLLLQRSPQMSSPCGHHARMQLLLLLLLCGVHCDPAGMLLQAAP